MPRGSRSTRYASLITAIVAPPGLGGGIWLTIRSIVATSPREALLWAAITTAGGYTIALIFVFLFYLPSITTAAGRLFSHLDVRSERDAQAALIRAQAHAIILDSEPQTIDVIPGSEKTESTELSPSRDATGAGRQEKAIHPTTESGPRNSDVQSG
ncbi:hypothetical protein Pmi06nite_44920 [Planotetraspora mira]|uniref:Uncharacterized protein n=1 Tax=Planotetraspora mira TaxID=58121 RepID=A0A8J3U1F2_9ACTN|nr:hypothetical protein Pmi06nite_44920 [Planotetraspora mira]